MNPATHYLHTKPTIHQYNYVLISTFGTIIKQFCTVTLWLKETIHKVRFAVDGSYVLILVLQNGLKKKQRDILWPLFIPALDYVIMKFKENVYGS